MPNIEIKASADTAAVVAAYDTMLRKQEEAIKNLKTTARESREAGKYTRAIGDMAGGALGEIVRMAAGYLTVRSAISLASRELEAYRQLNRDTLKLSEELAAGAGRAALATTGLFAPEELQRRAAAIATGTGVGQKDILAAFSAAGEVGQRIGPEALSETVRTAARITAVLGGDIGTLSKTIAQVSEAGGVSAEAAAGFLLRNRRGMNLEEYGPGLISAIEAGGTLEEAAEFTKFFERASPKIRGGGAKLTADLFQTLMQEQVFPREEVTAGGKLGIVFRSLAEIAPEARGVTEAMRIYRQSLAEIAPEEREGVLGRLLVGQGGARAQLGNLLTSDPGAIARMAEIQAAVLPPGEADRARVGEVLARAERMPAVAMGQVRGLAMTAEEALIAERGPAAFEEHVVGFVDQQLRAMGANWSSRFFTGLSMRAGIGTPEEAVGALGVFKQYVAAEGPKTLSSEAIDRLGRSIDRQTVLLQGILDNSRQASGARAVIPYGEN